MGGPLVSVGLQFFNSEKTLHLAIQSILRQTYQNWELILHDDGSRDRSREIASGFHDGRIRFFTEGVNRKLSARINESLLLTSGKYYARMDGDDVSYPDRLSKQVEYLEKHPEVDLLGAGMIVFDNTGKPIGKRIPPTNHERICRKPWSGFPMAHPTFMGRTVWFRKYFYDTRSVVAQDQDLLLRAHKHSKFANLPIILVGYREAGLYIRKIILSRYDFSRSLIRYFRNQRRLSLAVRVAIEQCLKTAVDCIATGTGLKYHMLRHRARPFTNEEKEEWVRIWNSLNC